MKLTEQMTRMNLLSLKLKIYLVVVSHQELAGIVTVFFIYCDGPGPGVFSGHITQI